MQLAVALMVVSVWAENMWSSYAPAGVLLEKKIESVAAVSESTQATSFPYVFNDMATFFTLLVGIYFPSVTGKGTLTSPLPFFSSLLSVFSTTCVTHGVL